MDCIIRELTGVCDGKHASFIERKTQRLMKHVWVHNLLQENYSR